MSLVINKFKRPSGTGAGRFTRRMFLTSLINVSSVSYIKFVIFQATENIHIVHITLFIFLHEHHSPTQIYLFGCYAPYLSDVALTHVANGTVVGPQGFEPWTKRL